MRWSGVDLQNLVTKTVDELTLIYPEQSRKNLERRKQEYKKKLGEVMEREPSAEKGKDELDRLAEAFREAGINFSKEDLAQADRAGFHVGYIRNSEGEIEYTKPLPHIDFGKKGKQEFALEPVTAAIIKPSRMRPAKRDHRLLYVFSDAQIGYRRYDDQLHPIHDENAIRAALLLAKDLNPDFVVDCADTTDFAELSTHPNDSDHFQGTLQPSLQRTHDLFAEFTAVTPNAEKRVTVASNHVKRLTSYVLKNSPVLHNIRGVGEKYPALSYPGLLKLDEIGWEYIDGYPAAEYEYKPDLVFTHGTYAVSGGSTANKYAKENRDRNIVAGHKHSIETQYNTDRRGRLFGAFIVGALCRIDGVVPSYWSAVGNNTPVTRYENWQNGVCVIRDYGDGNYEFSQVPIRSGVIHFEGKVYDGNQS